MSIEDDYRAVLVAYAPLTALIPAAQICQHVAPQGTPLPVHVFNSLHQPSEGLDGNVQTDQCTIVGETWAQTAAEATAAADQIVAALDAHDAANGTLSVTVISRQSVFDPELELSGEVLNIEWWRL